LGNEAARLVARREYRPLCYRIRVAALADGWRGPNRPIVAAVHHPAATVGRPVSLNGWWQLNDLLKAAQAAIDRKPTLDELRAVQDPFGEPATTDDLAFEQVVGGIGDPIAHAIDKRPSTPVELREWCKNARLAILVHEAGTSPNLNLLELGAESGLSPAKRLAAIALQYLSEQGGIIVAYDLAASVQAVDELSDVLPIIMRIEEWCRGEAGEEQTKNADPCGKWLYDKAVKRVSFAQLVRDLAARRKKPRYKVWPELTTSNSIKDYANRYAERNGLPLIEKRKPGAPRKK